jgi:hypothetical protein
MRDCCRFRHVGRRNCVGRRSALVACDNFCWENPDSICDRAQNAHKRTMLRFLERISDSICEFKMRRATVRTIPRTQRGRNKNGMRLCHLLASEPVSSVGPGVATGVACEDYGILLGPSLILVSMPCPTSVKLPYSWIAESCQSGFDRV